MAPMKSMKAMKVMKAKKIMKIQKAMKATKAMHVGKADLNVSALYKMVADSAGLKPKDVKAAVEGYMNLCAKAMKKTGSVKLGQASKAGSKKKREPTGKKSKVSGDRPDADDAIKYVQENPKRAGTPAYDRYEKYKSATTKNEALSLGATTADILHDWKKGFIVRA
eukprot:TRINITY_DN73716_c0_g1_i1.p1 TRINITY_DN73716_c0_g1~~TRINITY_DN73716_c0_g1_i1.p1  ORF type:complete len:166 (-),score=40.89 TRINITY_DN73716_c0_g1_i1:168-665(-)